MCNKRKGTTRRFCFGFNKSLSGIACGESLGAFSLPQKAKGRSRLTAIPAFFVCPTGFEPVTF